MLTLVFQDGKTALYVAVEKVVTYHDGSDPKTELMKKNMIKIVTELLTHGADVNFSTSLGIHAVIHLFAQSEDADLLKILKDVVDKGADLMKFDDVSYSYR